jgi:hypothetical protein
MGPPKLTVRRPSLPRRLAFLRTLLVPHWTRYAKATARFMFLIGSMVTFGIGFTRSYPGPDSWVNLGLLLALIAALFYDPDNPPYASRSIEDEPHDRREDDTPDILT